MPSASASAPAAVFAPPPPGLNYVAALDPSIKFLLIGTACSATLFPLAVLLFFFSDPAFRRRPLFILNVFIIALGFLEGAINIYIQTRSMLTKPVPVGFSIAFACLEVLVPMLADTVLLLRVVAVYHPRQLRSTACVAGIYVPIAAIKVARMIVEILFVVQWTRAIVHHGPENIVEAGQEAWLSPYPKAAWVLQLVDSTFASVLFLLRLKEGRQTVHRTISIPGVSNDTNISEATKISYYDRLKTLFWISVSNFVFPVILDLALLVLAFRNPRFLDGAYILMVSNYVDIVGVLLATIWSTSTKYPHVPQPGFTASGAIMARSRSRASPRFAVVTVEEQLDEPDGDSIPMTVFKPSPTPSDTPEVYDYPSSIPPAS
ncbi:hypothetical protein LXA43DRAFT_738876 [Ganoderma leucocontextum]|nr:hypothetical protein LXA43DRAFT_738876 [Ganoderma leucocontextum]